MAFQSVWFTTGLPEKLVETIDQELFSQFEDQMQQSILYGGSVDLKKRNSQNAWIPAGHWVSGFLWNYVQLSNRSNFLYDIDCIDMNSLQYTKYQEGQFYGWHNDAGLTNCYKPKTNDTSGKEWIDDKINTEFEMVRKLSIVMQLSDPEDYEGGNLQLLDENGKSYFAPRQRGTVIIFDSRTQHRVLKVTKGIRRSIVGWVVGPRWK
jgi:predicted 2-oxoglutarate/Fe(II)-dependent dioxygenase YbiX